MKTLTKLWIAVLILVFLSPLGIIVPYYFKSGSAWGEWGAEDLKNLIGYIPSGLAKLAELWKAPLPDYAFSHQQSNIKNLSISYIISGLLGVSLIAGIIFILGKFLINKKNNHGQ